MFKKAEKSKAPTKTAAPVTATQFSNPPKWASQSAMRLPGGAGGGMSGAKKAVLGLLAVALLCGGYLGFQAYTFYQESLKPVVDAVKKDGGMATEPKKIKPILAKIGVVPVPKGYRLVAGMDLGLVTTVSIGPPVVPGQPQADGTSFTLTKTNMPPNLGRMPPVDPAKFVGGKARLLKSELVPLKVGGKTVKATRQTLRIAQGGARTQYVVPVTAEVMVLANGPSVGFDEKALKALLAGMKVAPKAKAKVPVAH